MANIDNQPSVERRMMGYFANGTEGMLYEEQWCQRCVHCDDLWDIDEDEELTKEPCAVWMAHLLFSYKEANNPESILDILIPHSDDGLGNEQCRLFILKGE